MGILLLLLCLALYFLLFNSLLTKQGNTFICTYIIYIWIYDWLFINLSYFIPNGIVSILKFGNEGLVILAIFMLIAKKIKTNNIDTVVGICYIFTMLYAIVISFVNNIPFDAILQGIRLFFGPVIYIYIICKLNFFNKISFSTLKKTLIFLLVISLVYSIYQSVTFTGDLTSLWFYNYLKEAVDFDVTYFNYIRDDKLRATSFFVSPIFASLFFSSISLFIISLNNNLKINIIIFLLGGLGVYLSGTRIGIIYIALFIILLVILNKKNFAYSVIAMLFAVIITIVSLIFGISNDPSALGRLTQYNSFLDMFLPLGYGLEESMLIMFDSYVISTFIYIGIFAILIFVGMILLTKNNYYIYISCESKKERRFYAFIIINSICLMYEFFFQHIAGSFFYKLTFLMLFVGLSYSKTIKEKKI